MAPSCAELPTLPSSSPQPTDNTQKEVERRRRENINDGINEIARLIPGGQDKVGKGQLLRRAAEHLAQVKERLSRVDAELAQKDHEKAIIKVSPDRPYS